MLRQVIKLHRELQTALDDLQEIKPDALTKRSGSFLNRGINHVQTALIIAEQITATYCPRCKSPLDADSNCPNCAANRAVADRTKVETKTDAPGNPPSLIARFWHWLNSRADL